jgi:Protein of unknown function (DUF4242)
MSSKGDARPQAGNFLVERYLKQSDADALAAAAGALRRSARQLTDEGRRVRFVRSIFLPEDETCFDLYEASSAETVEETARRAGVSFDRIVPYENDERSQQ